MFENLKSLVLTEAAAEKEKTRFHIEHGYCKSWSEENQKESDNGIERYCTPRRWDQYRAGEITREKIVELTIKRANKQRDKYTAEKLEKLERAAAAPDLVNVTISVEWKRSATWGYNPTATVTVYAGNQWKQYTASASGCGYDKRTAAVGAALNQSDSIKKMLYSAKEKALNNPPEVGRYCGGNYFEESTSNNSLIHYGAGYGVLPYFEGGVGINSFRGVFEACGYKCTADHGTKYTDFYQFEKMEV